MTDDLDDYRGMRGPLALEPHLLDPRESKGVRRAASGGLGALEGLGNRTSKTAYHEGAPGCAWVHRDRHQSDDVVHTQYNIHTRFTTVTPSISTTTPTPSTSTLKNASKSIASSSRSHSPAHTFQPTRLPSIVTATGPSSTSSAALSLETREAQPSTSKSETSSSSGTKAEAEADEAQSSLQKGPIIGGLCGAIAALVLIGILLCVCLRRRRPPPDPDSTSSTEKGIRPALARKWTDLTTTSRAHTPCPGPNRTSTPSSELDERVIRVSLDHWPRPFAHNESWRDSMGPGRLCVTNPDESPARPDSAATKPVSESPGTFLQRQRAALNAVFVNATSRSRGSSRAASSLHQEHHAHPQIAAHTQPDPDHDSDHHRVLSPPHHAPLPRRPSLQSYPSTSTDQIISPEEPEDPFLTPSPSENPPSPPPHHSERNLPPRPSSAPPSPPSPARSNELTLPPPTATIPTTAPTHPANLAPNPRGHSNPIPPLPPAPAQPESLATDSRHSNTTFSSAGDPFQLDRPSLRSWWGPEGEGGGGGNGTGAHGGGYGGWEGRVGVYEGT